MSTFLHAVATKKFLRVVPLVCVALLCAWTLRTFAATTPDLGAATSYAVLAGTYTNTSAATTVTGDIGFTTGPATAPLGVHDNYGPGAPTPTARIDAASALTALAAHACTFTWVGAVDLSTDPTHGTVGVYTPGVYCSTGAMNVGGALTLSGSGTYIFRADGALTSTAGSVVTLSGASACDVFWTPTAATTLGATTTFVGTVIDNANAITVGADAVWSGRALSLGAGTVTTGAASTVTVPTCTVPPGTLHVVKTVVNDNGGTSTPDGFQFSIDGAAATTFEADGQNDVTVAAGTYTVTEPTVAGYTTTLSNCTNVSVPSGGSATCTVTNNDIAPSLTLDKTVVNDNGGTALASAWTLTANGGAAGTLSGAGATGTTDVQSGATFKAGTYALSESAGPTGYTASAWSCVKNGGAPVSGASIVLALADTATCTVTNNDVAPVLHVVKYVVPNSTHQNVAGDFSLHVTQGGTEISGSPAVGVASPGRSYTLAAGTYVVGEDANASYLPTFTGHCDATGTVTLAVGDDKTCAITNSAVAPGAGTASVFTGTINVVKLVVNDNGGTGTVDDFPLFVNDAPVVSGVTGTYSANGERYTVTETSQPGYTATFSGDCDADGAMTLRAAEHLFCVVTNNDVGAPAAVNALPVPPLLDVVKVPSPLALPDGPGAVTYTYTLRNPGTVPIANVTMVGDTCGPIVRTTGDTNGDDVLDVTETWTHTCTTTLTETHTNTVVATGWANGLSATDIASATVVVGAPIVPPLIHVTKIPSPLTLLAGGGMVTYTETITNPGTVPLENVSLVDDKCSPVTYVSGDTNSDELLDPAEAWTYTCSAALAATTTNTATATGEANGLTAKDVAIVTVVVALPVPSFPNTGVAPLTAVIAFAVVALFGAVVTYGVAVTRRPRG